MLAVEYNGINSFLVGISRVLLENGVERNTRGYKCWELPEPVMIKIKDPLSRWVTIPERKWNMFLPYAESLWLALGRNDLDLVKYYLPRMEEFSDDRAFLRGGYGPRLRSYNGNAIDYTKSNNSGESKFCESKVDQFLYITEKFKQDPYTRQAIITIGDPSKDCFDENNKLKQTKDLPCTRTLQFMKNSLTNKLDLTVYVRSNDFIWGATAVNIFNYTFMQEYIASIIGLEVGSYFHIVNNLHYYEYHKAMVEQLANVDKVEDSSFCYNKTFHSLSEFDSQLKKLERLESDLRTGSTNVLEEFNDDFFNDWAKILFLKIKKENKGFVNQTLNFLANKISIQ